MKGQLLGHSVYFFRISSENGHLELLYNFTPHLRVTSKNEAFFKSSLFKCYHICSTNTHSHKKISTDYFLNFQFPFQVGLFLDCVALLGSDILLPIIVIKPNIIIVIPTNPAPNNIIKSRINIPPIS